MLLGEYRQDVNTKGQVRLPNAILPALGRDLVLTRGFERNLLLFPAAQWRRIAERLAQRPLAQAESRALRRRLFSGAVEVDPDSGGRIMLPGHLRNFAGIDDSAVLIGLFDHMELWSETAWGPVLEEAAADGVANRWAGVGV